MEDNTKSVVVSTIINNVDADFIRALLNKLPVDLVFDAIVDMSNAPKFVDIVYTPEQERFAQILEKYYDGSTKKAFVDFLWRKLTDIANLNTRYISGISNKIIAIKGIREETGLGLKSAMDFLNSCIQEFGWDFV